MCFKMISSISKLFKCLNTSFAAFYKNPSKNDLFVAADGVGILRKSLLISKVHVGTVFAIPSIMLNVYKGITR